MERDIPKSKVVDHVAVAVSAALQTLPFMGGLARYLDEYYPSQQRRLLRALADELCVAVVYVTHQQDEARFDFDHE